MLSIRSLIAVGVAAAILATHAEWFAARTGWPSATDSPDSLTSPAAPGSTTPNLALAPDGRIYMSWLEPADTAGTYALRFAVLDTRAAHWSAPQTIRTGSDFFLNWADFPSIRVLDGRVLAAHWLQRTGRGAYAYGVRISISRDGGKRWSSPIIPHRDRSETEHGFVTLWPERDGLGAAWLDGRQFKKNGHDAHNEMMLVSTTVRPNGVLGRELRLDDRTCDCCQNAAAMTTDGPVVAYRDRSVGEIRDIYVTRRVGGAWTAGVPVYSDNWKIAACPVNGPAIAATGRRVAVAWFTATNDTPRVKIAFSSDAGARFATPAVVDDGNPAGRVDVALLSDGGALVSWIERTGGEAAEVRARRIDASGRRGAAMTIAVGSAARASGFPRMAVTSRDSSVVFAWTAPGRPSAIRVARTRLSDFH